MIFTRFDCVFLCPFMSRRGGPFDFLIKLLLIGDTAVGKSCFLLRYADDQFTTSFITTIGIDFKIKTIELEGKRIKLQIWDTAGQERFRTITTAYYRGAMGILLIYDITNEKSFQNIRGWMSNIEKHAADGVEKLLVGNKCDMQAEREVSIERGQSLADEFKIGFFEASAKTNLNVTEAFQFITRNAVTKLIAGPQPPSNTVVVDDEKEKTGKNGKPCC